MTNGEPAQNSNYSSHLHDRLFLVMPFKDRRASKTSLGTRRNILDDASSFDLLDKNLSYSVAKTFADFLRSNAINAEISDPRKVSKETRPYIKLSGEVLDLSVIVDRGLFSASISVRSQIAFRADNEPNKDTDYLRITVGGTAKERTFWPSDNDLKQLVLDLLHQSFRRFVSETYLTDENVLRLK